MSNLRDIVGHLIPNQGTVNTEENLPDELPMVDAGLQKKFAQKLQILNECIAVAENPTDIHNESSRIAIFTKLAYGLRKSGEAYAWALYHQKVAKYERKRAEAIAALDTFGKYVERKKAEGTEVKSTDKSKEYYVSIDEAAQQAARLEAYCDAIAEQFSTIRYELSETIKTLRAMCYGVKDSQQMSGAATNHQGGN